jgi:hypothetical protein
MIEILVTTLSSPFNALLDLNHTGRVRLPVSARSQCSFNTSRDFRRTLRPGR